MFRFTIRELVLLTVIVALVLGWCADHTQVSDREALWRDAAHKFAQQVAAYRQSAD